MVAFFLLPPSCIVALIGNIANKLFFSSNLNSFTMDFSQTSSLPTMFPNNMGMDFSTGPTPDNYDEMRGRTLSTNKSISSDTSMSLTKSSVIYHERMTLNNSKDDDNPMDASPELSYETEQEKVFHISKVADQQDHMRTKEGNIKATVAHGTHNESVINIQLPYNP